MFLIAIFGLFFPRIAAIILYFFTTWFSGVFVTWWWPLLGFIFMPFTMLWYSSVMNWYGGEWGFIQIIGLIIAVLLDAGATARSSSRG